MLVVRVGTSRSCHYQTSHESNSRARNGVPKSCLFAMLANPVNDLARASVRLGIGLPAQTLWMIETGRCDFSGARHVSEWLEIIHCRVSCSETFRRHR